MKVLGVDQSYRSSGVVLLDDYEIVAAHQLVCSDVDDIFDKAYNVAQQIGQLIGIYKPDFIGMEGLAFGSRGNVTRDLAGLMFTIVHMVRIQHGYIDTFDIVPPTTLKKFATGHGRSKKKEMYEVLPIVTKQYFKDLGFTSIVKGRQDVTDAYWIAKYFTEKQ